MFYQTSMYINYVYLCKRLSCFVGQHVYVNYVNTYKFLTCII